MFLFNSKKSLVEYNLFSGFVDHHSHMLYGIDDGMKAKEESFKTLDLMESIGYKGIYFTPHIMEDVPNKTEVLKKKFEEYKAEYTGNLEIHLASENMLDNLFEERLKNNDFLPLYDNFLLVETSYYNAPTNLKNNFFEIQQKGYNPLFAHPERYHYIESMDEYVELKRLGVKFQLNIPSIAGFFGKKVYDKSVELLKKGMYDIAGSDTHSFNSFQHIINLKCDSKVLKLVAELIQKTKLE